VVTNKTSKNRTFFFFLPWFENIELKKIFLFSHLEVGKSSKKTLCEKLRIAIGLHCDPPIPQTAGH
jgi:hypothetical protein